jgi:cell division protein FtsL
MKNGKELRIRILVCLAAFAIPALLVLDTMQARRYAKLENQVKDLEQQQTQLVEENKKLVTDISVLTSSDRIEKIAGEELGMHKAKTDEIIRVEIKGNSK